MEEKEKESTSLSYQSLSETKPDKVILSGGKEIVILMDYGEGV